MFYACKNIWNSYQLILVSFCWNTPYKAEIYCSFSSIYGMGLLAIRNSSDSKPFSKESVFMFTLNRTKQFLLNKLYFGLENLFTKSIFLQ